MYRIFLFQAVILMSLLTSCSLTDLRPSSIKSGSSQDMSIKGKELITNCYRAHGWHSVDTMDWIETTYLDDWSEAGFIAGLFNPWPVDRQRIRHAMPLHSFKTSRTTLLDGDNGNEIWGIDNGQTYKKIDGFLKFEEDNDISFFLPTFEYFLKMPKMMTEVPNLWYVGDTTYNDLRFYLVFGTWDEITPNADYDQYIYWINSENYLLEFVEYTIREMGNSIVGSMFFTDFRTTQGLTVPYRLKVVSQPYSDRNLLHEIVIEDFTLLKKIPSDLLN